ncbi:hypothetical protein Droror1_Dr00008203 [Drosera rotundifolia]
MDPRPLMSESGYRSSAAAASYNFSEIWPFAGESSGGGGGMEMRMGRYGAAEFGEGNVSRGGSGGGGRRKRREAEDEAAKAVSTSGNGTNDSDGKRVKAPCFGDENHNSKGEGDHNAGKGAEQNNKPEPLKDYIHVRARRGQATDSHSLAERARREKISERMRILQDLVPGCNKVIGKALVLDEIINYIQSLQRQVEFLSMKLEAVNSRMTIGIDGYPSKDFGHQAFDTSGIGYGSQAPQDYDRSSSPEWLHMQIGGGFERQT